MRKEPRPPPEDTSAVQPTDLRSITRMSDTFRTTVMIDLSWDNTNSLWLTMGLTQLSPKRAMGDGRWTLEARMTEGVTDFEHDSAYALRLPLIGVIFEHALSGQIRFNAWVDPNGYEDFHVPTPGYDPAKHPESVICNDKHCGEAHVIVPEGFYVPPKNGNLYKAVRGKPVKIIMGPNFK